MQKLSIDLEDLGNNKWLVIINGEEFNIYAPNEITARSRAIERYL